MELVDRQTYDNARKSIDFFLEDIKRDETNIKASIDLSSRVTTNDENLVDKLKMLFEIKKSSFVLMLYNIIEANVTKLIYEIINLAVSYSAVLEFKDFNIEIRKLWIKLQNQHFSEIGRASKGDELLKLHESLHEPTNWNVYSIFGNINKKGEIGKQDGMEKIKNILGASGNLDFKTIERIFENFNIPLRYVQHLGDRIVETSFPKGYKIALNNIKDLRNKLAHGNISFFEDYREKTVDQLGEYRDAIFACLESLIRETEKYCEELRRDLEEKKKNKQDGIRYDVKVQNDFYDKFITVHGKSRINDTWIYGITKET